jgi:N-dimethylarginine dimethylaminohydrolase
LAPGEAIYYPEAFDAYGRRVLEKHVGRLLAADEADAHRFGCNAVVVGKTVIVNSGCARLEEDLRRRGYTPVPVELDEFIKSGGSAKCLTLRLDGEDAAVWG